jgi:hypothetical protein
MEVLTDVLVRAAAVVELELVVGGEHSEPARTDQIPQRKADIHTAFGRRLEVILMSSYSRQNKNLSS